MTAPVNNVFEMAPLNRLSAGKLVLVPIGCFFATIGPWLLAMAKLEHLHSSVHAYAVPLASLIVVVALVLGWPFSEKRIAVRLDFGFSAARWRSSEFGQVC